MMKQPITDPKAPKIEFPCRDFPIKVMGEADVDFKGQVLATLADLGVEVDESSIRASQSRTGRFTSLTVLIVAESANQLSELNTVLRRLPAVKMVL